VAHCWWNNNYITFILPLTFFKQFCVHFLSITYTTWHVQFISYLLEKQVTCGHLAAANTWGVWDLSQQYRYNIRMWRNRELEIWLGLQQRVDLAMTTPNPAQIKQVMNIKISYSEMTAYYQISKTIMRRRNKHNINQKWKSNIYQTYSLWFCIHHQHLLSG